MLLYWIFTSFVGCTVGLQTTGYNLSSSGRTRDFRDFPDYIELEQIRFENWNKDSLQTVAKIWAAYPKSVDQVTSLANWALKNGYKLRPSGNQYSWSPLTVFPTGNIRDTTDITILIKAQKYLNRMEMVSGQPETDVPAVSVETGASMMDLLTFLEVAGFGLSPVSSTSMGFETVGGIIATGAHGTGVPPHDKNPGQVYSILSNLIINLDAIVWDETRREYVRKTFYRSDPQINPLLTSIGQVFISRVTLLVQPNQNMRCQSFTDVSINDLLINPKSSDLTPNTSTVSSLIDKFGSVVIIHFPFTTFPWLRTFTVAPEKPPTSRQVSTPFNYPFIDSFPPVVTDLLAKLESGNSQLNVKASQIFSAVIRAGLSAFDSRDIWGPSKNILMYVRPSTVPTSVSGFNVLTTRSKLQQVAYEIYQIFETNLQEFSRQGKYPINTPFEMRISALDSVNDLGIKGAQLPTFSPGAPLNNKKFDITIWFDITTLSKTMYVSEFMYLIQDEFNRRFNGDYALVRSEWTKRFGYSRDKNDPWTNKTFLHAIPNLYSGWNEGMALIQKYDPYKVFSNPLVEEILF